jgi:predicted O-methyltransferase YrrM
MVDMKMLHSFGRAKTVDLGGWFDEIEAEVYQSLARHIRCGVVIEVGVWKGRSLSTILEVCRRNETRVYAVDTWKPDLRDGYGEAAERNIEAIFRQNIRRLGYAESVEIFAEKSCKASRRFPDGCVDLVFIDAEHSYKAVMEDIRHWFPKISKSGTIAGHDYTTRAGVRRAVDELFGEYVALPGGSIWAVKKSEFSR